MKSAVIPKGAGYVFCTPPFYLVLELKPFVYCAKIYIDVIGFWNRRLEQNKMHLGRTLIKNSECSGCKILLFLLEPDPGSKFSKILGPPEKILRHYFICHSYNELFQKKNRFQSVPIAALCLYNIQRESLVLKILLVLKFLYISFFN